MVPKAGKFFGVLFSTERGVTQVYQVSPEIFNIVVDSVVRLVLLEVYGDHEAHHGLGWAAGKHNIVFYAYYSRKEGRNPIWVQMTLTLVVSVFDMMGLLKNIGETKSMVCTPGFIW